MSRNASPGRVVLNLTCASGPPRRTWMPECGAASAGGGDSAAATGRARTASRAAHERARANGPAMSFLQRSTTCGPHVTPTRAAYANSDPESNEAANATLYSSEDGVEGFKAFAAKRKPVWKGR